MLCDTFFSAEFYGEWRTAFFEAKYDGPYKILITKRVLTEEMNYYSTRPLEIAT